jgi:uncharacterized RDD family membrane protein YckC
MPQAPKTPRSPVQPLKNASRAKRFAAMMYEGVLLFAVVFIASYAFDTITESRHGLMFREGRIVALFVAIGLYFVTSWRRANQTLPMKAWHMRLVNVDGSRPTFAQLLVRYVLTWPIPLMGLGVIHFLVIVTGWPAFYLFAVVTPFLIFVPSWFTADGQFLHDRLVGTKIIDYRETINAAPQQKPVAK